MRIELSEADRLVIRTALAHYAEYAAHRVQWKRSERAMTIAHINRLRIRLGGGPVSFRRPNAQ
jgi:hypothetical protein